VNEVLPFSVEASLKDAQIRLADVIKLRERRRVDLQGLPLGALAMLAARAEAPLGQKIVFVTPTADDAQRLVDDLNFFLEGKHNVLHFPSMDTNPFVEVAPDRRTSMDRLAVLAHLALDLPWRCLVMPAAALVRKLPPRAGLSKHAEVLEPDTLHDRDALIGRLVASGYLRVPAVEDPGTFAVRGQLIDIFSPAAKEPARLEFDDEILVSIRSVDTDSQRSGQLLASLAVQPAREIFVNDENFTRAASQVRTLCDDISLPTTQTARLVEEFKERRFFIGIEHYLPAFYPALGDIFEYLDKSAAWVLIEPETCHKTITEELADAERDQQARIADKRPSFAVHDHYLTENEIAEKLSDYPLRLVHRIVTHGKEAAGLAGLHVTDSDAVLRVGAQHQDALAQTLANTRKHERADKGFEPLVNACETWVQEGLRVCIATRTLSQAERTVALLRSCGLKVGGQPLPFEHTRIERSAPGIQVVIGPLRDGFVLATEALAFLSEEEIFGSRGRRREPQKQKRTKLKAFLEDLRELNVGDHVVHAMHGVGRYLGMERKTLPQSRNDMIHGTPPVYIEVLVVEYAGGDRLFLPITRLNQIEKFSGELQRAKLDRLGGKTFATKKSRVAQQVKKLADDLLKLYAERSTVRRPPLAAAGSDYQAFEATFPFDETPDQARAIDDVLSDFERETPMDRLVCGDVGFGKTEVALRAAFRMAMSGRQVGVLAPTTVLAQQHFRTFSDRMENYPLTVRVLSRFVSKTEQTQTLTSLKQGTCDIVIGTHRLLSKDVRFKELGLLIVDEEQRFGVAHKERIKQLRAQVDVLTLSATPIPRTLQLALGGLRDLSLITTPPIDRRAVRTFVMRWDEHVLREAIERELSRGGQVFFVHNRIETLYERAGKLQALMPQARIAVAHGQMDETTLEDVMTEFVEGRYDILCSTAIIESGLDIPRANTILIDRADMFGLAQLYQLRGRVGRSKERAYAYLIAPPLSQLTDEARARIEALERFSELGSGFHVASLDMEIRGAGDLLGAEQSGEIAAVGFDMFVSMLEQAIAEMRGENRLAEIDPEMTVDIEHLLPEDYVDDVGLRLSLYKRFASAESISEVQDIAVEMEERFGTPPTAAMNFVRTMRLRPTLRELRILGCDASERRVTFHLPEDTALDPAKTLQLITENPRTWKLTPDMKLTFFYPKAQTGDTLERAEYALSLLSTLRKKDLTNT